MDMNVMSNQPVPVRSQAVTVQLIGGASMPPQGLMTDASGAISVANDASATQVQVTDRFGNTATVAIQ